jgi:hypothetical protein
MLHKYFFLELITSASNNHNLGKDKFPKILVIALCFAIKAEFRVSFKLILPRKNRGLIMLFYRHHFIISSYLALTVERAPLFFISIRLTCA